MAKKEYNKSLSARIRRRNAQGFKGEGTPSTFTPNRPGNYRDPLQNHKKPLHEIIDPKTGLVERIASAPTRHEHMIAAAKKFGLRHAGSKSAKALASHF